MLFRAVKSMVLAGALGAAALQLLPGPERTNPPTKTGRSLYETTSVPGQVRDVFRRSCMDCHSHETRWPWYSHIAPLSWGIASDVARARKAVNISEWPTQPTKAVGVLTAMCAGVTSGRMPLPKYALLHPNARLDEADRKAVCEWTHVEIERQIAIKRSMVSQINP
jgi:hypothetical protein